MIGKNLIELELPRKYGVMVVGVRKGKSGKITPPLPEEPLKEDSNLIIVSHQESISKLVKNFSK